MNVTVVVTSHTLIITATFIFFFTMVVPASAPAPVPIEVLVEELCPEKPWKWGRCGLSSNPSITPKFVERHLDKDWNWGWGGLSSNPSITPEFVERHLSKGWWWCDYGLSANPSITPAFVERHLDKRWWWGDHGLSSNPSIPPEFIVKHKDRTWDWKRLSYSYTFSASDWAWYRRKDTLHVFRSIGQRWRERQKWVVKADDERQARLGALLQRLAVSRSTEEGEVVAIIGRQVASFL